MRTLEDFRNNQKINLIVWAAVLIIGAGIVAYGILGDKDVDYYIGYYMIGGFIALGSIIAIPIFINRLKMTDRILMGENILARWPDTESKKSNEIIVSAEGLFWDYNLYPFKKYSMRLEDLKIAADPDDATKKRIFWTFTSPQKNGRATHHYDTPIPKGEESKAEGLITVIKSQILQK